MNRLTVLAANVATMVVLTAGPAWAQFNLNGGNNTRGVHFVDPDNITASASSEQDGAQTAAFSSNGSNINEGHADGDYIVANTQGNGRGQWHSDIGQDPIPITIRWTFDQNYDLTDMWLWNSNMNAHGGDGRGVRDVEVWTSSDGSSFNHLTDYIFTHGPHLGTAHDYYHDMDDTGAFSAGANEVDLGSASLRAVELRLTKALGTSNYGSGCCVVIEEVRFNIGEGEPQSDFTWNIDSFGDWTNANNWDPPGGGPPGDPGEVSFANHTATFGSVITSTRTVVTDTAVSVRAITFDDDNTYVIAGGGSVNLIAASGAGLSTSITGVQGTHQFQAAVNLHTDTTVNISSDSTLIFNNALDLNGNVLNKTGAGELAIRNDLLTGGGMVSLQQGTLSGNGTVGGDVVNDGGTVSPGNSLEAASVVPEPTTLLLVMIGAMGLFTLRRSFRRKE